LEPADGKNLEPLLRAEGAGYASQVNPNHVGNRGAGKLRCVIVDVIDKEHQATMRGPRLRHLRRQSRRWLKLKKEDQVLLTQR
jgi:hypothetical protein